MNRSIRTLSARALRLAIATAMAVLFAGCKEQGKLTDTPFNLTAGAQCTDGETRECGRTLAQRGEVLSCLHGVQRCEGGTWGDCTEGTIREFPANETPVQPGIGLSSLSDPVNCEYSPCDPYCRNYQETPEEGITTMVGGGNGVAWLMGSMADLSTALADKGMADTCATGSDCQLNSYCRYPDTDNSCGHSKCSEGDALIAGCDPCVDDICAVSPECCQQPDPDPCVHDPCAVGDKLKAECSTCTTKICAVMPECCSGTWTAACVAAVATVCEQTCGCCAGEQGYNGSCYHVETATKTWDSALNACKARTSWNLASIADQAENTFVGALATASNTWIGLEQGDNATENEWRWTSGQPSGVWLESSASGMYVNLASGEPKGTDDCTRMNSSDTWAAASCTNSYESLCEGPPQCTNGTPPTPAACTHNPCQMGSSLAAACDPCVTEICKTMPSCCTTAWTAACIAEVANTCGNTCECGTGEVAQDGHCYFKDETDRTWATARTTCQARGTGWDISTITDNTENTFVNTSVIDNDETWIGFSDATVQGTWTWATGNPAGNYVASGSTTSTAIAYGSSWKYRANNVDPGATWTAVSFNDSAWTTGNGQLGFGDGDEATAFVKNGPSYYFRKTFTLTQLPTAASLSVLYDDGYVAYINGVEVAREAISNIAHAQYATGNVENAVETGAIVVSSLVVGTNVLAVLVKTRNSGDNDLSFDATLSVTTPLPTGGIYQKFASGEPNNDGDCARLNANKVGTWADAACSAKKDSICEGPYLDMVETGPRFVNGNGNKVAIPKGDIWKYLATGSAPASTWNAVDFNDAAWLQDYAEFGFGDSDETTSFTAANPTYYFRREIEIEKVVTDATLTVIFDDGFVAYVNGQQVAKKNISNTAHSAAASASSTDNQVYQSEIDSSYFVQGKNVIAVMVKNSSVYNGILGGDLSFDLQLDVTLNDSAPTPAAWSEACVEKVATVCGAMCDDAHERPLETGICTPWYPHETSPTCAGIDLSVGLPCEGAIPVCNHGNTEAPAGIRVVHFPSDSQQMPKKSPNLNHAQMKECFTQEAIAPGACVNLTGCPGLQDGREIMVNPPGTAHVAECLSQDNWSIYNGDECQAPLCSGGTSVATVTTRAVDIVILVDNSGSMAGEIEAVQERINEDLSDISSSGIDYRVIMMSRYGDVNVASGGSSHPICVSLPMGGNTCIDPAHEALVNNPPDFYHYSVDIGSTDAWCKVLSSWNTADEFGVAPTGLKGLLRPEAFKEFLVISDDRINCSYGGHTYNDNNSVATGTSEAAEFDGVLLALSPEQFGTAQKRNYVWHSIVGMQANSPSTTPWPASAPVKTGQCSPGSESAGTGHQSLSILTGGLRYPSCQNDNFDAMFQALAEEVVEGAALSCSFEVANAGHFDPARTSLVFTSSDDSKNTSFERVAGIANCQNHQFYYVDEDTIELCPQACATVQGDPAGRISLEVGCQGYGFTEETYTQRYEGVCPEGSRPQWGFFAYETETPGDSKIEFSVRTAPSEAGLADATYEPWATAAAETHTEVCSLSGPTPCPIDIFEEVGGYPAVHYAWLELSAKLTPSSDGAQAPVLNDWRFTYSCLPSE